MSYVRIQHWGKTAREWNSENPVLKQNELGVESDTKKIKFGDGQTAWIDLPYASYGVLKNDVSEIELKPYEIGIKGFAGDLEGCQTKMHATFISLQNLKSNSEFKITNEGLTWRVGGKNKILVSGGGFAVYDVNDYATGKPTSEVRHTTIASNNFLLLENKDNFIQFGWDSVNKAPYYRLKHNGIFTHTNGVDTSGPYYKLVIDDNNYAFWRATGFYFKQGDKFMNLVFGSSTNSNMHFRFGPDSVNYAQLATDGLTFYSNGSWSQAWYKYDNFTQRSSSTNYNAMNTNAETNRLTLRYNTNYANMGFSVGGSKVVPIINLIGTDGSAQYTNTYIKITESTTDFLQATTNFIRIQDYGDRIYEDIYGSNYTYQATSRMTITPFGLKYNENEYDTVNADGSYFLTPNFYNGIAQYAKRLLKDIQFRFTIHDTSYPDSANNSNIAYESQINTVQLDRDGTEYVHIKLYRGKQV